MKTDSLLYFLTQRTSPEVTKEFQRVLSDLSKKEKKDLILDIIEETRTATGVKPDVKLPNWLTRIADSRSGQAKQIEKLIDMSPEDIENLFKILRSPSNAELVKKLSPEDQKLLKEAGVTKDEPLDISTTLSPRMFEKPITPQSIQVRLNDFLSKNKDVQIKYSTETYEFNFQGTELKFDQLMKMLGVQPTSVKFMKSGKTADFDIFKQKVLIRAEGEDSHLLAQRSPTWVASQVKQFQEEYKDVVKKAVYDPATQVLEYHGPKNFLPNLLRKLGVKPNIIEDYELKTEKNSGAWDIRFMPYKDKDYLISWMENMDATSPKLRERWDAAKQKAQELSKQVKSVKLKNLSTDPEEDDWVIWIQGTLAQVREVFEKLFDKKIIDPLMKEFVANNQTYKVEV